MEYQSIVDQANYIVERTEREEQSKKRLDRILKKIKPVNRIMDEDGMGDLAKENEGALIDSYANYNRLQEKVKRLNLNPDQELRILMLVSLLRKNCE